MPNRRSQRDVLKRLVRPANAVWEVSPGQLAIGSLKICQKITNSTAEDQEAVWEDADHNRFCVRPNPTSIPATYDENTLAKPKFFTRGVGIYRVGSGVLVKVKSMGLGGTSREPEAMKLIQKQAPSVPVPEVLHHWNDPHWFCHITIMREIPGGPIGGLWYGLDPVHQQRLAEEIAGHLQAVAEIQSETAIYANGESLADSRFIPHMAHAWDGWEPMQNDYYFNMKQLEEFLAAEKWPHKRPPGGLGDRFHLCHMDASPWHFFVSNGQEPPLPPDVKNMPLEEQAKLHISGIIDWERAGFYPRFVVSWQLGYTFTLGLPNELWGKSLKSSGEFDDAVIQALIERGFQDPRKVKWSH